MKPAPFEYLRASAVEEACDVLAEHGSDAKLIAGGQSLVPMMAMRLVRPALLVDISELDSLKFIAVDSSVVRLGAATRQSTLESHEELSLAVPLVREALSWVGHAQTRNRGTIGGSVVHADPSAELPLVAAMLDATLCLLSRSAGVREVNARSFFAGPMSTHIRPDECLTELHIARPKRGRAGYAFDEVSIRHGDFALVSACAQVVMDPDDRCIAAGLAVGGAGPVPLDVSQYATRLVDSWMEDMAIEHVVHEVVRVLEPPSDLHASSDYRRQLARVLCLRVLQQARERARRTPADPAPA